MNDPEATAKAARFKAWAESDGLFDFLDQLKAEYVEQMVGLSAEKTDALIAFKHAIRTVDLVKQHILTTIEAGKVSAATIKDIHKIKEGKKKRFF